MPRAIHKLKIMECSTVDKAANPHAKVVLIKRDSGEPASFATREEALQAAADQYISKVAKSASPWSRRPSARSISIGCSANALRSTTPRRPLR
jgi:hypothetical protein